MQETSHAHVAQSVLLGIETDQEDIYPEPISLRVYAAWKEDHKAVEKQFASM